MHPGVELRGERADDFFFFFARVYLGYPPSDSHPLSSSSTSSSSSASAPSLSSPSLRGFRSLNITLEFIPSDRIVSFVPLSPAPLESAPLPFLRP